MKKSLKHQPLLLAILFASFLLLHPFSKSFATIITAVASGDWSNPNSWSPAQMPVAGDDVTINGFDITVTADAACASLNISGGNFASPLNVSAGVTLTISGDFGTTVVAPGGNCTIQVVGSGTIVCGNLYCSPSTGNVGRFTKLRFSGPAITTTNVSLNSQDQEDAIINNAFASPFTILGAVSTSANGGSPGTTTFDAAGAVIYGGTDQTIFPASYNTLNFSGSGIKSIPAGVTVNDILVMEGTATAAGLSGAEINYASGASIRYAGSSHQTTGIEFPTSLSGRLTVDNSSGITVTGNKTIESLTTQDGIITAASGLTITETSPFSFISGGDVFSFVDGPVTITLPADATGTFSYTIPVGNGSTYLPFTLVSPQTGNGGATATIQAFNSNSNGAADASTIFSLSNTEYWALTTAGDFTDAAVSVTRQTSLGALDAIALSVTANGSYNSIGGTISGNSIINSNNIGTNPALFFALGGTNIVLPYKDRPTPIIERPREGKESIQVYPNPVTNGYFSLKLNNLERGNYKLTIVNSLGQRVFNKSIIHTGGTTTQKLNISGRLGEGNYILQLSKEDGFYMDRQIIVK